MTSFITVSNSSVAYILEAEECFRKIDANKRIQKRLAQQTHGYVDSKYHEGEKVFFKEQGKEKWSGPAKVTGEEGSKVRIIHAGYDRTVPKYRVIPAKLDMEVVVESQQLETEEELEERSKSSQGMEDKI